MKYFCTYHTEHKLTVRQLAFPLLVFSLEPTSSHSPVLYTMSNNHCELNGPLYCGILKLAISDILCFHIALPNPPPLFLPHLSQLLVSTFKCQKTVLISTLNHDKYMALFFGMAFVTQHNYLQFHSLCLTVRFHTLYH